MKLLLFSVALVTALLGGCASIQPHLGSDSGSKWIVPEQAVLLSARAAPEGVHGTFSMRVQSTGSQKDRTYVNSELDYRDQRNLTVALTSRAAQQLGERLGADPLNALKGKDILVEGSAVRTKIYLLVNGRATEKYYYQTHVNVTDAAQITVR